MGSSSSCCKPTREFDGNENINFECHERKVTALAFSPDSRILATGSVDGSGIRLWNMNDFNLRRKKEDRVEKKRGLNVYRELCPPLTSHQSAHFPASSSSSPNTTATTSSSPKTTTTTTTTKGQDEIVGIEKLVWSPPRNLLDPSEMVLASADEYGLIILWRVSFVSRREQLQELRRVRREMQKEQLRQQLHYSDDEEPHNDDIVVADEEAQEEDERKCFAYARVTALGQLTGHRDKITGLAFERVGLMRLASCSRDESIRVWNLDLNEGSRVALPHGHVAVTCIDFSPDGEVLVSGAGNSTLMLWESRKLEPRCEEPILASDPSAAAQQFHYSSSSHHHSIEMEEEEEILSRKRSNNKKAKSKSSSPTKTSFAKAIRCVRFLPNSSTIFLSCAANEFYIRTWSARNLTQLGIYAFHGQHICFSPFQDFFVVSTGYNETANIVDILTGEQLCDPLEHDSVVKLADVAWCHEEQQEEEEEQEEEKEDGKENQKTKTKTSKRGGGAMVVAVGTFDGSVSLWQSRSEDFVEKRARFFAKTNKKNKKEDDEKKGGGEEQEQGSKTKKKNKRKSKKKKKNADDDETEDGDGTEQEYDERTETGTEATGRTPGATPRSEKSTSRHHHNQQQQQQSLPLPHQPQQQPQTPSSSAHQTPIHTPSNSARPN